DYSKELLSSWGAENWMEHFKAFGAFQKDEPYMYQVKPLRVYQVLVERVRESLEGLKSARRQPERDIENVRAEGKTSRYELMPQESLFQLPGKLGLSVNTMTGDFKILSAGSEFTERFIFNAFLVLAMQGNKIKACPGKLRPKGSELNRFMNFFTKAEN